MAKVTVSITIHDTDIGDVTKIVEFNDLDTSQEDIANAAKQAYKEADEEATRCCWNRWRNS